MTAPNQPATLAVMIDPATMTSLTKFAAVAGLYADAEDDAFDVWCDDDLREIRALTLGDFRRLRALAANLAPSAPNKAAAVENPPT